MVASLPYAEAVYEYCRQNRNDLYCRDPNTEQWFCAGLAFALWRCVRPQSSVKLPEHVTREEVEKAVEELAVKCNVEKNDIITCASKYLRHIAQYADLLKPFLGEYVDFVKKIAEFF
jgi:hypothetical protein